MALRNRYMTLAIFSGVLIIMATLVTSGWTRWSFFPTVESETATASLTMPVGTPFEVTDRHMQRIVDAALELQEKYDLIRPGMRIVDLGAAPGGWCQVALPLVGATGRVLALDILEMEPLPGVDFIQGDFTEDEPLQQLEALLEGQGVDLVLSDMAPNMSGMAAIDQAKAMYLAELALEFVKEHLKQGDL